MSSQLAATFRRRLLSQRCHAEASVPELLRGLAVLKLCSTSTVAKNAEQLYSVGCQSIGKRATDGILRRTFFDQLVAGETDEHLEKASARLLQHNTKLMLCPPMEDIDGRIADTDQAKIKANTDRFIEYLEMSAELNRRQPGQQSVVQFKPTAVFPNELMEHYSIDHEKRGIPLIDAVRKCKQYAQSEPPSQVDNSNIEELTRFCMTEWMRLGKSALQHDIPILVDGELRLTYYMLHAITLAMSSIVNSRQATNTLIYGTYQCYMRDTQRYLEECLAVSKAENFRCGLKCVRGAYLERERSDARKMGYADPTCASQEATNQSYNRAIATVLGHMAKDRDGVAVFIATMNRESVEKALDQIEKYEIPIDSPQLNFGQIFGMCDHISFALGSMGANTFKSTPWGTVDEWVPYFGRRAAENHSALKTARNELPYYKQELLGRVRGTKQAKMTVA